MEDKNVTKGYRLPGGGSQFVREGFTSEDMMKLAAEETERVKGKQFLRKMGIPETAAGLAKAAGSHSGELRNRELDRKMKADREELDRLKSENDASDKRVFGEKSAEKFAKGGLVKKTKPKPVMKMAKGGMMCSPRKKMAMGGMVKGCKRSGVK